MEGQESAVMICAVLQKKYLGFPAMSDTSMTVKLQKMTGSLKFHIKQDYGIYYHYSNNKSADQLPSNQTGL